LDVVLDRLSSATVAVFGVGGVGSWCAESLCRSGVGSVILVDLDDVCVSNSNRQLHATTSSVGRMKIDVTRERLLDINPHCDVGLVRDFVTEENAADLLGSLTTTTTSPTSSPSPGGGGRRLTACVDAIDGVREKTALLLACVDLGIPVVTCGGAAGRRDPTRVVVDDLTRVSEDRLLFKCRKSMRQDHGFAKVPPGKGGGRRVRSWRINAVYSTEVVRQRRRSGGGTGGDGDDGDDEDDEDASYSSASSFRACDGAGVGTASFVTGTYGLAAACKVVEMIALDKLVVPKRQGNA
jgi:tRNA A37 threonylcarbamoyladenosine dehydratase